MGKNNSSSWTSILFMLKSKGINIKDYDYNDKTNEKKMIDGDHPFVMYGRRFYQNPYLWGRLLESRNYPIALSIMNHPDFVPDLMITRACLGCADKDNTYPSSMTAAYLTWVKENEPENLAEETDNIITAIAESNRYSVLLETLIFINANDIKPKWDTWGNAGNGDALLYAIDGEDTRLAVKLLELGADPSKNDSMAFAKACKKAKYKVANMMIDKGVNIHTKHDLALRMIERNDSNNVPLSKEENEFRLIIIEKFIKEKQ
jgi:hypothetical protein